jgi:hypothetical protein
VVNHVYVHRIEICPFLISSPPFFPSYFISPLIPNPTHRTNSYTSHAPPASSPLTAPAVWAALTELTVLEVGTIEATAMVLPSLSGATGVATWCFELFVEEAVVLATELEVGCCTEVEDVAVLDASARTEDEEDAMTGVDKMVEDATGT